MTDLKDYFSDLKSVLCLNGAIPKAAVFTHRADLPLIAADGAANNLINMSIVPQIIVGDLDSLVQFDYSEQKETIETAVIHKETEVIQIQEQITTDCEKALQIIAQRNLFPCIIYGATGKESDHMLHNLQIIAKYSQQYKIILHDSACISHNKYGLFIQDKFTAELPQGANISFFAFTDTQISTHGLRWDLTKYDLTPMNSNSRNAVQEPNFSLTVHCGQVLVLFDDEYYPVTSL